MTETDEMLVQRSREGDDRAFQALCQRYDGLIRRRIEKLLPTQIRKRLSVSDVMQETYATVFVKLPEYRGDHGGAFRRWVLQIAEYKAREANRHHLDAAKRAAAREVSRHERPATGQLRGRGATPSAHAIAAETHEALDQALAALPEDYRKVLRLVHEEGLTMAEAGAVLDRSAEAARKLYGRAVSRLAQEMGRA